ncbi:hypothetical protein OCK74_10455 [Chitinophagaceae bacterium LB-8]|uniref:Uncharacterized protein n=1 Tax=Paraflavisolibacter caeni TaxID=2982496 RepID=A0A9X2XNS9_9BACT|nr:hypothetical protein [Paraflavisolibacter caeni]MCU7549538.1 hypothetical protein [Paraflavisolibacter caeni]
MSWDKENSVSKNYPQGHPGQSYRVQFMEKQEKVVDLNLLLISNWKRFEKSIVQQMAARLDPLPLVEGDETQWHFVIDGLLTMIMKHPPKGFFFLHIKCDPYTVSTSNVRLKKGFRNFQIDFNTNITVNESWIQLYNNKLKEIELTVDALKGSFAYNRDVENGCLFSITLPGKQD